MLLMVMVGVLLVNIYMLLEVSGLVLVWWFGVCMVKLVGFIVVMMLLWVSMVLFSSGEV